MEIEKIQVCDNYVFDLAKWYHKIGIGETATETFDAAVNAIAKFIRHDTDMDSGLLGKIFEITVKSYFGMKISVSKSGCADVTRGTFHYEMKSGAGVLSGTDMKLVRGSSRACFVPVLNLSKPIEQQYGYVTTRDNFIELLDDAKMLCTKKPNGSNSYVVKIQTYYNHKLGMPHGKKIYALDDAAVEMIRDGRAMTFADWMKNGWTL